MLLRQVSQLLTFEQEGIKSYTRKMTLPPLTLHLVTPKCLTFLHA